jgi:hypothetical protein
VLAFPRPGVHNRMMRGPSEVTAASAAAVEGLGERPRYAPLPQITVTSSPIDARRSATDATKEPDAATSGG